MRVPQDNVILNWVHNYFFKGADLVIFDVGTNMGDYISLCFDNVAGNIKTIYGFEPNKDVYEKAVERFQKDPRVKIQNLALGSEAANDLKLHIPGKLHEVNGEKVWKQDAHVLASLVDRPIWHTWSDCTPGTQLVNVTTLDQFIEQEKLDKIDYLKIDVEGLELEVLKGASKSLKSGLIKGGQFEYGGTFQDAGIKLGDVVQFLNDHDYNVYDSPVLQGPGVPVTVEDDYTWSNIVFKRRKA